MKALLLLLLLPVLCIAQTTQKFSNVRITAPDVQGTPASVARIFTLATNGTGETVTPTNLWSAVVLTGQVDSSDLADRTTIGGSYITLTNPSSVTFPRQNANNTVTSRTATELKTDLSLENVNNTSDANKPVSTAQQTALDLKANAASPTFSGLSSFSAAAPTVASAATIAPTTHVVFVSGTTQIDTITVPSQFTGKGGQIVIIPTGVFTTSASGNIALGSTAVVGKALIFFYDSGTNKWYPSY